MQQIDEHAGWVTALLAGASGLGLFVWKTWLRVRSDLREDGKGSVIHGTYEELVDGLRAEIARLRGDMAAQREMWEREREQFLRRITELELRCDTLMAAQRDGE